ncbi:Ejaculatory bulb-specific protein 3 [Orchesella cincta]|uniref:Ejaculatory bulb-specific protein 3 n=1 Tax=Orchesella cincta TaxID=48709 RepID=A0A1D2N270_ORCCI|nr:Ejaculatory bulb-specific protein 3 [Orchesella cincta]
MTRFALLCLVVALSISEGYAASLRFKRQLIPREFQNINIENYLKNERAVRFQLKCIIDDGPCDRIGKYLKVTIPELLVNQCANCDMAQRERAGKLVSHIQQNFPEDWERAVRKFQGGLVKPEDAARLESVLGVKLDPKLVGPMDTSLLLHLLKPVQLLRLLQLAPSCEGC